MLKTLAKSIREYKKASVITPVFVVMEVILECIIPFIIATMVNNIKSGAKLSEIAKSGSLLVLLALLSLVFGTLSGFACARAACGFAKNLRKDMFYRIQNYSFSNIDKYTTSSLVTRMTTDITNVQEAFMMLIRIAIRAPFMMIFAFIMAFVMGGRMAWIFVLIVPLLALGLFLIARLAIPLFRKVFKKYDKLNSSVQENIKGMRVVKTFVREDYEQRKFGMATNEVCRDFTKAERIIAINGPMMQFCLFSVKVFVLSFGSYIIITTSGTEIDVGQLSAMITYSFMILSSLMMLSMVLVIIVMAGESARRISEVLNETGTIRDPENPVLDIRDGSITFENVSFKYSDKADSMVLSDINLTIRSGETVGIVGPTGSAKSSLIQLIPRLYDATVGSVRIGGLDVRKYGIDTLRNQIAVVLQKNVLFSGTIRENLLWGDKDANDDEIAEACKLACADEFISALPDGYDSYIEQGGSNVSGGQKQRLCIARALLKKPKILILDDSTSAVDMKTDAKIRKAMREFIPDTTKIIIAQRTASVEEADKIIVMKGGRIDAVGTHDELINNNAIYREMYISQNKAGTENEK